MRHLITNPVDVAAVAALITFASLVTVARISDRRFRTTDRCPSCRPATGDVGAASCPTCGGDGRYHRYSTWHPLHHRERRWDRTALTGHPRRER